VLGCHSLMEDETPSDAQLEEVEQKDLDGHDCADEAQDLKPAADEGDFSSLEPEELKKLDEALRAGDDVAVREALAELYGPHEFFRPGGGWRGAEAPGRRAERIGHANGLRTTATKQQRPSNPGSDHDPDQRSAFAVDLSNGTSPTPQMDRTARQIAAAVGRPSYTGGFLPLIYPPHRMRVQLIWRWTGHYNHVHAGFRRT
jgi:hypothetical protein